MTDWAMTDADFEREKARVGAVVKRWIEPLGLKMWQRVEIGYWREALTGDDGEQLTCTADCHVEWMYKHAHLRFCLPRTADQDDEQLDYIVRHEMCHALVHELRAQPFTEEMLAHEERVVTELAMVLGWVREQGQDDAPRITVSTVGPWSEEPDPVDVEGGGNLRPHP